MGYHHLALAARDMNAIHNFYEGVMGFDLVKVEVAPVPEGGWAKHFGKSSPIPDLLVYQGSSPHFSNRIHQ